MAKSDPFTIASRKVQTDFRVRMQGPEHRVLFNMGINEGLRQAQKDMNRLLSELTYLRTIVEGFQTEKKENKA